jgi:uncharacterized tellurite resistance protein B-like protein
MSMARGHLYGGSNGSAITKRRHGKNMALQDPKTISTRDMVMKLIYGAAPGAHDPEVQMNLAKATMIIVGGDGEITPAEWSTLVGTLKAMGASDAALEALRSFDFKGAKLEDYLSHDYAHFAQPGRVMLFSAIWASRADGSYGDAERIKAERAAEILGISKDVLTALEGLVAIEAAASSARAALLFPAGA